MEHFAIYLRRGEDWSNISADEHLHKTIKDGFRTYVTREGAGLFVENLKAWRKCFGMSYTEYRAGLEKIARRSWDKTQLNILEPSERKVQPGLYSPANLAAVAITDDDDFFVSDIGTKLHEAFVDPDVEVFYWDAMMYSVFYKPMSRRRTWLTSIGPSILNSKQFASNGYAVRVPCPGGWVNTHSTIAKDLDFANRPELQRWFGDDKGGLYPHCNPLLGAKAKEGDTRKILYVQEPLSLYTRHPASTYLLRNRTLASIISPLLTDGPQRPTMNAELSRLYLENPSWARHMSELNEYCEEVYLLTVELLSTWRG